MTEPPITYTWKIERIDCAPIDGQLVNVVRQIHWRLLGSDDTNTVELYGDILLESPTPAQFSPYSELDQSTVIDWLEAAINARAEVEDSGELSVEQLHHSLARMLDATRVPPVQPMPLPWE
jgi:hypothetical protein